MIGSILEPRDDPAQLPMWALDAACPLVDQLRSEMDSIIDTPRETLEGIPLLPRAVGTLAVAMQRSDALPLTQSPGPGNGAAFDTLYQRVTSLRY